MPRIAKPESNLPTIDAIVPNAALPGGEVDLLGSHLGPTAYRNPVATLGETPAPVLMSRSSRMTVRVPEEATSGPLHVTQNGNQSNAATLQIAQMLASGVHAVASPAVDFEGNVFTTFSGSRGQNTPVSVFRIDREGEMQPFVTGVMNATGVAIDAAGYLYVSSRHDGTVHRVSPEGAASVYAEGMGIATGIAFDAEQNLYVGDRSGTIFKIAQDRQIFVFATLEPSVAAYHLAFGLDGTLYVTGPTTSSIDNVYAIDEHGTPRVFYRGLGRPQGMSVDVAGNILVAGSFEGRRGIVRITPAGEASVILSGSGIVGLTLTPAGIAYIATGNAIYHVALGVEGLRLF